MWRTRSAGTLSQIFVASLSGRSSFSGSFRCSFYRCKFSTAFVCMVCVLPCVHCAFAVARSFHVFAVCFGDCLMASGILFGFPSALQQVYVSCEDCARGARSELYVFSRRRSNSFQGFSPSSFHHVRLLPRCLLPHRCLVCESDHAGNPGGMSLLSRSSFCRLFVEIHAVIVGTVLCAATFKLIPSLCGDKCLLRDAYRR